MRSTSVHPSTHWPVCKSPIRGFKFSGIDGKLTMCTRRDSAARKTSRVIRPFVCRRWRRWEHLCRPCRKVAGTPWHSGQRFSGRERKASALSQTPICTNTKDISPAHADAHSPSFAWYCFLNTGQRSALKEGISCLHQQFAHQKEDLNIKQHWGC